MIQEQAKALMLQNGTLSETFDFTKAAAQANGSVWYQQKKAVLLATVVVDSHKVEEPFLPLTVQYIEKSYAAAKIPGGFIKREMKPGDFEMLTARIVDRALRPLFPESFRYPITITVTVLSSDSTVDLQLAALHAASAALYVSDVPISQMVCGVRIAKKTDTILHNPTLPELSQSTLDLFVAGHKKGVSMIEMRTMATQSDGSDVAVGALDAALAPASLIHPHQNPNAIKEEELIELIGDAQTLLSQASHRYEEAFEPYRKKDAQHLQANKSYDESLDVFIDEHFSASLREALQEKSKVDRATKLTMLYQALEAQLHRYAKEYEQHELQEAFERAKKEALRRLVLDEGVRIDGRELTQVRPIEIETNVLPSVHGSCLFRRGETQVLATVTLGDKKDAQMYELLTDKHSRSERFMLHYNFPPYSVGESKPIGAPSRRELGHGNLAKRALEPVIEPFEGTIRLVSEVLESNGSSSMATVCAGSLALRSANISMCELVAGIAMGVVCEDQKCVILTDILGLEDQEGDMDLKIAGTARGVTALQMDIKIDGISIETLRQTLLQARQGRLEILALMREAEAKITKSQALPTSSHFTIDPSRIGEIIGRAGSTIREIIERFEVAIDLDRKEGKVKITGEDEANVIAAQEHIESIASKPKEPPVTYKVGAVYKGRVLRVVDFGVFVEMPQGGHALLHISKISKERPINLSELFTQGDEIEVCVLDQKGDKIELALPDVSQ